jgi:hypothetical protein
LAGSIAPALPATKRAEIDVVPGERFVDLSSGQVLECV